MMREPTRWQSHIGQWVTEIGAHSLADQLASAGTPVTADAVYKWVSGRAIPRAEVVFNLIELSGGRLTITDIYAPRFQRLSVDFGEQRDSA